MVAADGGGGSSMDAVDAVARLSLKFHGYAIFVASLFWALWLLVMGVHARDGHERSGTERETSASTLSDIKITLGVIEVVLSMLIAAYAWYWPTG